MITSKEVHKWWLNGFVDKDPRGPAPSLLHIYDYNKGSWKLFFA